VNDPARTGRFRMPISFFAFLLFSFIVHGIVSDLSNHEDIHTKSKKPYLGKNTLREEFKKGIFRVEDEHLQSGIR
jgi:hypothetical protein